MTVNIGDTLKGRYRIVASLGRGGMADVYKVWDTQRSTHLALKLLRDDLAQDLVFMRRFKREAQNLAQLQHPNIVRFYGLEEDDLKAFILMEYVEGPTLREEIRRAGAGGMSLERIQQVMGDVCSALSYAHNKGLVHCDIKSGNVLIDKSGKAYLSDFGIARGVDAATSTMVGIGTPAYMAPELIKGLDPTPQTDIYALGILLYEMLTGGERPFTGERATITGTTAEKVRWEHLKLEACPVTEVNSFVNPYVVKIVKRCLQKDPSARFTEVDTLFQILKSDEDNANHVFCENNNQAFLGSHLNEKQNMIGERNYKKKRIIRKTILICISFFLFAVIGLIFFDYYLKDRCRIVFVSKNGENFGIYTIKEDGTHSSQITANEFTDIYPIWSPKGKEIVFSSNRDGDFDIYKVDKHGNNIKNLTDNNRDDLFPFWSADGEFIIFSTEHFGYYAIMLMQPNGMNKTLLFSDDSDLIFPLLLPNNKIVYCSDKDGDFDIYRIDLSSWPDLQYAEKLTINDDADLMPMWIENKNLISYISSNDNLWKMMTIGLNGENPQLIFGFKYPITSYSWSPDGSTILFSSIDDFGISKIYSFNLITEELKTTNFGDEFTKYPVWSPLCK